MIIQHGKQARAFVAKQGGDRERHVFPLTGKQDAKLRRIAEAYLKRERAGVK